MIVKYRVNKLNRHSDFKEISLEDLASQQLESGSIGVEGIIEELRCRLNIQQGIIARLITILCQHGNLNSTETKYILNIILGELEF